MKYYWDDGNNKIFKKANEMVRKFLSENSVDFAFSRSFVDEKILWIYWDSGEDLAPNIVKRCIYSAKKRNQDRKVIVLDKDTINDYIHIPSNIQKKFEKNQTHYSDLIRVMLLSDYGGAWADATCLFAAPVTKIVSEMKIPDFPESFARSGFFAYTSGDFLSNWFLVSAKKDIIVTYMKQFLLWYWDLYNELPHYFWFHWVFRSFYYHVDEFRMSWDRALRKSSKKAHILQKMLPNTFEKDEFFSTLKNLLFINLHIRLITQ